MSVPMAIALSGQLIRGQPVMVKPSEAEKNLVQSTSTTAAGLTVSGAARRLYVGNLVPNITEEQLRVVFESFGTIELVQLPRDEAGLCKGFAFVQWMNVKKAVMEETEVVKQLDAERRSFKDTPVGRRPPSPPISTKSSFVFQPLDEYPSSAASMDDPDVWRPPSRDTNRRPARTGSAGTRKSAQDGAWARGPTKPGTTGRGAKASGSTPSTKSGPGARSNANGKKTGSGKSSKGDATGADSEDGKSKRGLYEGPDEDLAAMLERDDECAKFGPLKHIFVDKNTEGFVYLKFDNTQSAMNAQRALHGRWFAGKMISATYMLPLDYEAKFPESR